MNHEATQSPVRQDTSRDIKSGSNLLSAATITGDDVCSMQDEHLGTIEDIMLDLRTGRIRYAVLSAGGFLGMGDRYYAIPWGAFKQDKQNKRFLLDVDVDRLKSAPGFDKDDWPDMADASWNSDIESYYNIRSEPSRT